MKLNEIKKPEPVDEKEAIIEQFMEEHDIKKWTIKDGRVDVDGDVILNHLKGGKFPFPWGKINGIFMATKCGLKTYENFPTSTNGPCIIGDNKLTNFDGLDGSQKYISYRFNGNPIKSLHNIHKHIVKTAGITLYNCPIEDSILGLCLIEGLTVLELQLPDGLKDFEIFKPSKEYASKETGEIFVARDAALMIVRKYIRKGREGVLAAQEEMLDLELDDYAKL